MEKKKPFVITGMMVAKAMFVIYIVFLVISLVVSAINHGNPFALFSDGFDDAIVLLGPLPLAIIFLSTDLFSSKKKSANKENGEENGEQR